MSERRYSYQEGTQDIKHNALRHRGSTIRRALALLLAAALACNFPAFRTPTPSPFPTSPPATSAPTIEPSAPPLPTPTLRAPTFTLAPSATPLPPGVTNTPWATPPPGHIVFVCFIDGFDNLCLMKGDGSDQRRLTTTMATDFYPSLSADGQWITFSTRRDNNFEIYVMEVDGGNPRRLTQDLGSNFAPAFSPDGAYIAFTSAQGGFQNVWVMDADGSNARPLTDVGNNGDPEWSPDGRQISFVSDRGGTNELYVMNVADPSQGTDGADARPVAPGLTIGGRNDWSPDGQVLTFYAGEAGARNIFTLNLDGTDLRQLTHVSDNRGPSFSPDGEWIAFASFRDGNNEIYIVRPDGSQLTRLTNNTRPDWQPRWGP